MIAKANQFVLWGSAGHAKVLASLIRLVGGSVAALIDNRSDAESVLEGVPLYRGFEGLKRWAAQLSGPCAYCGLAAIGGSHGRDRLAVHDYFRKVGVRLEAIVHPQAAVCTTATIGAGSQILANAVVAADAQVGEACILNHGSQADHECVIGDGVHLAPGATLCGCVKVGCNVMVGAGAVVLPRLVIGDDVIIGAGAVVTRDVPNGVVVVGRPARIERVNPRQTLE